MHRSLKTLALLGIIPGTAQAGENNTAFLIIGATSMAVGGTLGGVLGYLLKSKPPHTLDALQKQAAILYAEIGEIESADPLTLAVHKREAARAAIRTFDNDAHGLIAQSFDAAFIAQLTPDERAHLEIFRKKILEKQHAIREKQALLENIVPHAALIEALNNTPAVIPEQISSPLAVVEKINRDILFLATHLERSRTALGAEQMAESHSKAAQRIAHLRAQSESLVQSSDYVREVHELALKASYEEAKTQRIKEERASEEMQKTIAASHERFIEASKILAEAKEREEAAALLMSQAAWKVRTAEDRERELRAKLTQEEHTTVQLTKALKAATEQSHYAHKYIALHHAQRPSTVHAFEALEREIENPSLNPENHQEWRAVLTKKTENARQAAIPTCAICTEELVTDTFIAHCDQGSHKATHEYHTLCIAEQKKSLAGKPLTCAQCRAPIVNG